MHRRDVGMNELAFGSFSSLQLMLSLQRNRGVSGTSYGASGAIISCIKQWVRFNTHGPFQPFSLMIPFVISCASTRSSGGAKKYLQRRYAHCGPSHTTNK
jgi:hypothetical protein